MTSHIRPIIEEYLNGNLIQVFSWLAFSRKN